jgi:hypothetical protein
MAKKPVGTLDLPPFPPLTWDGYSWTADVVLPAWRGFQNKDDKVRIVVSANEGHPPNQSQLETYRYLFDHDKPIADVIVSAVLDKSPWLDNEEDEVDGDCRIDEPAQLCEHLRLYDVYVHDVVREGIAYVGFSFGCDWETEHGLGVMMHRDRIVHWGGAMTASLTWIAESDAEQGTTS